MYWNILLDISIRLLGFPQAPDRAQSARSNTPDGVAFSSASNGADDFFRAISRYSDFGIRKHSAKISIALMEGIPLSPMPPLGGLFLPAAEPQLSKK